MEPALPGVGTQEFSGRAHNKFINITLKFKRHHSEVLNLVLPLGVCLINFVLEIHNYVDYSEEVK